MNTKPTKPNTSIDKPKKVFVGLSGGVDSAVSASLLKERGFDVVGVFIKVWHPEFLPCPWREERRDAMRVAAHLNIPFLFFDFEAEYKKGVADYMIEEYKNGRTPNPDVMCNREIKFGSFWQKSKQMGADYIATGHYARIKENALHEGVDGTKDQSYFLWTLTPNDLEHAIFPVGDLEKSEVRKMADSLELPVSEKKDSQGICFLGDVGLEDFLPHFIEIKPGTVLNTKGEAIGTHKGAIYYTLGERHGFEVIKKSSDDRAYYVVSKNMKDNTITVSQDEGEIINLSPKKIRISKINLNSRELVKDMQARVRYHGEKLNIKIVDNVVEFDKPERGLSVGQSIVFYDGDKCLGGAIVDEILG